ncbi:hypothetical protein B0H63DRAFT_539142 [Podospora didyma]|uniref:Uncharacterized protein n=1 Tax=Podospora didyma TaxID=330526 RepID=A0AAE0U513_9PEZI|nr:hypothetical protein B0H63DRAFT_539142 [Podospora didyma]
MSWSSNRNWSHSLGGDRSFTWTAPQSNKAAGEEANAEAKVVQKVRDFVDDGCKKNGGLGTSEGQFVNLFIHEVLDNLEAPSSATGPWVNRLNKLNKKTGELKNEKTFFLKLANAYILARDEPCKEKEAIKDKKIQEWEKRLTYLSTHESGIAEGLQEKIAKTQASWCRALQDHQRLRAACGTTEAARVILLGNAKRQELTIITRNYLSSLKDVVSRAEDGKVNVYIPELNDPSNIRVNLFDSWGIRERKLKRFLDACGEMEPGI